MDMLWYQSITGIAAAAVACGAATRQWLGDVEDSNATEFPPTVGEKVDKYSVLRPAPAGADGDPDNCDCQAGADQQCQTEHQHRGDPLRPAQRGDLLGDCGGWVTIGPRHEQPGGQGQAGAECRQHRRQSDRLPEHHSGSGCAHRPLGPGQQRRDRPDELQGEKEIGRAHV
jgi:hypothetical protein